MCIRDRWMGMPDAEEEYTNKTIDEGWQHCLTVPRELRVDVYKRQFLTLTSFYEITIEK